MMSKCLCGLRSFELFYQCSLNGLTFRALITSATCFISKLTFFKKSSKYLITLYKTIVQEM